MEPSENGAPAAEPRDAARSAVPDIGLASLPTGGGGSDAASGAAPPVPPVPPFVAACPNGVDPALTATQAIHKYLNARAADLERDFLPEIKTAADLERARPALRQAFIDMLGIRPNERPPLGAKVTGRLQRAGFTVDNVYFQSRPGIYVTANLYLPDPLSGRVPAIVFLVGHWNAGRDGVKVFDQDHAIWYATHGYAALLIDTIERGELRALHRGLLDNNRFWWHSAGYTPAGVEVWNAMRAIDYLESRPEIDRERIGATGISGGGADTWYLAALDDRVKVAVPVSGMSDVSWYVGADGVNNHCDCLVPQNPMRWNWTTIAALVAPRPLLFANSNMDVYFPMSGNLRIIDRLRKLYARLGAADKVSDIVSTGGHGYRTDLRRAEFEFMNRYLKRDTAPVTDPDAALAPELKIDTRLLRVFPTDADLPKDSLHATLDFEFAPLGKPTPPAAGGFEAWRGGIVDRLRRTAFASWPQAPPAAVAAPLGSGPAGGREVTEDCVAVEWSWRPGDDAAGRWLIVLNAGEDPKTLPAWAAGIVGRGSAMVVAPRGTGASAWTRESGLNTVERELAMIGTTADTGRVWDIVTVARRRPGAWRAAGSGNAGILAAYAALFEPSIESVTAVNPPASHRPSASPSGTDYGPVLLNVLRVLDIPDALGLLAPRRLVLQGASASDKRFDRTTALYTAAGAADKLERR